MAYHIYTTEGLIISHYDIGEAHRIYTIFTESYGLVRVRAVSVRKIDSKLRFSLQILQKIQLSMIRIGEMWQLIDAQEKSSYSLEYAYQSITIHIYSLLLRFLGFNIEHSQLYKDVDDALTFLYCSKLSSKDLKSFEILVAFMVLSHLGYVPKEDPIISQNTLKGMLWSNDMLCHIKNHKKDYINAINHSIQATQL